MYSISIMETTWSFPKKALLDPIYKQQALKGWIIVGIELAYYPDSSIIALTALLCASAAAIAQGHNHPVNVISILNSVSVMSIPRPLCTATLQAHSGNYALDGAVFHCL